MASTKMNASSSRSHFIMYYYLSLQETPEAGGRLLKSKCAFVDLAGSEKVKKTGATGDRLAEAQAINLGLTVLSRVIEALSKGRNAPFRDSILTHILKDSLAGNSKTTLLIALSPHLFNRDETVTTCRFGQRCKAIKMKVKQNADLTPAQMKARIKLLEAKVEKLEEELKMGGGRKKKKKKKKEAGAEDEAGDDDEEEDDDDSKDGGDGGGGMSAEEREMLENYKNRNEELRAMIKKLEVEAKEAGDNVVLDEEIQQKLAEYDDLLNCKVERDNLRDELENHEMNQRNLAIMNALLAERLDHREESGSVNQQNIVDLARGNLEHLKKNKKTLMQQLRELNFNDADAQEIFYSVFDEVSEVAREQEERARELEELEGRVEVLEIDLEKSHYEVSKLQQQLEMYEHKEIDPTGTGDGFPYGLAGMASMTSLRNLNDDALDAQEEYLSKMMEESNQQFVEKEERAWKRFLNEFAKEEGFKNGNALIDFRRKEAQQMFDDGEIDEVPEDDDELLSDVREDFYRLYDPATGKTRDINELEQFDAIPDQEYVDQIVDEDAVDDPFEWEEEEVVNWLIDNGLKKYAKAFEREAIDGRTLLVDINKTNLKRDLGVKSVHINKMMTLISELQLMSDGYDTFANETGAAMPGMTRMASVLNPASMNAHKGAGPRTDYDIEYAGGRHMEDDDEVDFVLSEEEKAFGENFWQIDELFNALDVHGTGVLDLPTFKHGLLALEVDMNDEQMEATFRNIAENEGSSEEVRYRGFLKWVQYVDYMQEQQKRYAQKVLDAIPKVAANRRQYVTRAAMVIKYGKKYNNSKRDINNYLLNKGLQRSEIVAAWKQYRFHPRSIRDIDFKSMMGKKGKLVDMAVRDPNNVEPFDPFKLYKLMQRAGFKGPGSKEFNDLDYLRAAGDGARISSIKCWFDQRSAYFNGLQVTYECSNKQTLEGHKNWIKKGEVQMDEMQFRPKEVLLSVTVYFAHFVCGMRFETDKRDRLFGSDAARTSTTLVAPMGTSIMAFYGSISQLFETIGCYLVVDETPRKRKGKNQHEHRRSGTHDFLKQKNTSPFTLNVEGGAGTTSKR